MRTKSYACFQECVNIFIYSLCNCCNDCHFFWRQHNEDRGVYIMKYCIKERLCEHINFIQRCFEHISIRALSTGRSTWFTLSIIFSFSLPDNFSLQWNVRDRRKITVPWNNHKFEPANDTGIFHYVSLHLPSSTVWNIYVNLHIQRQKVRNTFRAANNCLIAISKQQNTNIPSSNNVDHPVGVSPPSLLSILSRPTAIIRNQILLVYATHFQKFHALQAIYQNIEFSKNWDVQKGVPFVVNVTSFEVCTVFSIFKITSCG